MRDFEQCHLPPPGTFEEPIPKEQCLTKLRTIKEEDKETINNVTQVTSQALKEHIGTTMPIIQYITIKQNLASKGLTTLSNEFVLHYVELHLLVPQQLNVIFYHSELWDEYLETQGNAPS